MDDLMDNLRATIAVGPLTVSLGGIPYNNNHIEFWKKRAAESAAEIERLRRGRMDQIDYSVDLQRIIEDICHERQVRVPQKMPSYHYDMAVKYRLSAESLLAAAWENAAKIAEGTAPIARGNFFEARRKQCAKIAAALRAAGKEGK